MDYLNITNKYYANWLGLSRDVMYQDGIHYIKSIQRDICQKGYPTKFDLYIFIQNKRIIISYGNMTENRIELLKNNINIGDGIESIFRVVAHIYNTTPYKYIKFVFHHIEQNNTLVKELTAGDYPLFLKFYMMNNPKNKNIEWLYEYFIAIVNKHYSFGFLIDDLLVAATDAPAMPFMESEVQEIGINTLTDYRGKGYAKAVCKASINSMLKQNICPQWSTAADNIASVKLAYSIGFKKFADVLTISL